MHRFHMPNAKSKGRFTRTGRTSYVVKSGRISGVFDGWVLCSFISIVVLSQGFEKVPAIEMRSIACLLHVPEMNVLIQ